MVGITVHAYVVDFEAERRVGAVAGRDPDRHHLVLGHGGLLVLHTPLAAQDELGEWDLGKGREWG